LAIDVAVAIFAEAADGNCKSRQPYRYNGAGSRVRTLSVLTGNADGGGVSGSQDDGPGLVAGDEGDGPDVTAGGLDGQGEGPVAARRVHERHPVVAVGRGRVHDQGDGPRLPAPRAPDGPVRLHGYELAAIAGDDPEPGPEVLKRRHYRRQTLARVQHLGAYRQVEMSRRLLRLLLVLLLMLVLLELMLLMLLVLLLLLLLLVRDLLLLGLLDYRRRDLLLKFNALI
jgi:hypothetical protein